MTDYGATWSARQLTQDQRGERGKCFGRPAADQALGAETTVRSLSADRVLWARDEVLALRRRSSRPLDIGG
jgi:hypothetical protein